MTGKVAGGNTSNIVLWMADTAIVKKNLGDAQLYCVADAETGKPIEKANVEFFGYKYERPCPTRCASTSSNLPSLQMPTGW